MTTKNRTFVNLSNHPSTAWSLGQTEEALRYGEKGIVDMPFPYIDPEMNESQVVEKAQRFCDVICSKYASDNVVVHLMGEMAFCFYLTQLLLSVGIPVLVSSTDRKFDDATGKAEFEFVRFRELFNL